MTWKDKKKVANYISERRRKYKQKLVELKGGKCQLCGYAKCITALEFHHKDSSKEGQISKIYNRGWERILKEAEKTILVCANCHREIHEKQKSGETVTYF
jgi:predicted HNH restriction endonuclease